MIVSFVSVSVALGVALDRLLGEPKRLHPLVGFGSLARTVEALLNRPAFIHARAVGALALLFTTVPWLVLAVFLTRLTSDSWMIQCALGAGAVYLAIGWQSLDAHIAPIFTSLKNGQLVHARRGAAMIVSRDCDELEADGVAKAAIESLLENTSDAVIAPLFWFVVAGVPGIVMYRLVNTLDAMWGYRNARYQHFGWAAARLDDVLNYLPARLTAAAFVVCAFSRNGWVCWRQCAGIWASPNAGAVLASGAGCLGVSLGAGASYHGVWQDKPATPGRAVIADDLLRATLLTRRAIVLCTLALLSVHGVWAGGLGY
ncbi:adenosylcobinamide-phosphate synthase CbiB [Gilvimarinus sp. SDUM040013]|uniref:Cobalamin biosynthesis protein CobD n=1 Tax=Gilvimarinus gilvus TaxID=3058038 RepID=A0ABU4RYY8_9GAMM|nr:adenosylcobinamide-phosphate synthase CbiB [Gilvimarinus sp. SDUM040013]MDO3384568.1 adenosylcobinamide-phosphate synthase CbiB [Gilvimarinus sp. SDUM040013]MDX6850096.1 adenosylcobinamide-phosphate synthase CbiB [Gilvimarinus sp. SDUM040013]